jgi:excisionase family DNA binding protein
MSGETVSLTEAAGLMKVHPETVSDHIRRGTLAAAKIGRSWVMMRRDVLALIEREIAQQTAERMRGVSLPHQFGGTPPIRRRRRVGVAAKG